MYKIKQYFTKQRIVFFAIIAGAVLADQLTKGFIVKDTTIIKNFLRIEYVENTGAAWGMLKDATWFFIVMTFTAFGVLFLINRKMKKENKTMLYTIATACMVAGGLGNLIDRIIFSCVRDFIHFTWFSAIFNVADVFVSVGTVLVLIYLLFQYGKNEKKADINHDAANV